MAKTKTYDCVVDCGNCGMRQTFKIKEGTTIGSYFQMSYNGGTIRNCKKCKCDVDPNGVL